MSHVISLLIPTTPTPSASGRYLCEVVFDLSKWVKYRGGAVVAQRQVHDAHGGLSVTTDANLVINDVELRNPGEVYDGTPVYAHGDVKPAPLDLDCGDRMVRATSFFGVRLYAHDEHERYLCTAISAFIHALPPHWPVFIRIR
jgi:hypothetical protein